MNQESKKQYFIPIDGKLYETSQEVYEVYYKMDRRERYLQERDLKMGVLNFCITDEGYGVAESTLPDESVDIEEEVTNKIIIETVLDVIAKMKEEDRQLIQELFFYGKTERQLAKEMGIPRTTIQYRMGKIMGEIKKVLKI